MVSVCHIYVSRRKCVGRYYTCLARIWLGVGFGGGGGLPVGRHSYGGHGVELWRASLTKKRPKQLKVKQNRQTRVYLGFIRPKTGTTRFGPIGGSQGALLT